MTNEERLPPHSVEAEEATLGGILIDPDAIYDVAHLEPRHFSRIKNRDIFRAMRKLVAEEKPIDFIMVSELLNHEDDPYLVGLLNVVPTSVETRHYANIVFELAKRRELLSAASKIATLAYDEEQQIDAILGVAQNSVLDVASNMLADGPKSAADGFSELFDAVVARQASDGLERKISTGFSDIDYILSHLRGGALYVLAARPGMGKSMLESNIRLNVAKAGFGVLAFNLEMSAEQIFIRTLAADSKIEMVKLSDEVDWNEAELRHFGTSTVRMGELPMWVDDTPSATIAQMHGIARRIQARHGLDLVTVDYLQLVRVASKYNNRVSEVGAISRGLKLMARDLDVPLLVLSQLSRSCEGRQDKRPILSDLRDSGDIEQDADVVMFIYRDGYYDDFTERPNVAEVNIAKNRHGKTGKAELFYDPQYARFANLERKDVVAL